MSIGPERDVGYREAAHQEVLPEKRFVRRDPWDFFDLGEWFLMSAVYKLSGLLYTISSPTCFLSPCQHLTARCSWHGQGTIAM